MLAELVGAQTSRNGEVSSAEVAKNGGQSRLEAAAKERGTDDGIAVVQDVRDDEQACNLRAVGLEEKGSR